MTVKELRELLNNISSEDDNCEVVMPMQTNLPGIFAFEGVCSGVTEMIIFGPCPTYIENNNGREGMRALLIAPHSYHDEDQHERTQEILN